MFEDELLEQIEAEYNKEESSLDFESGSLDIDVDCDLGEDEEIVKEYPQYYF